MTNLLQGLQHYLFPLSELLLKLSKQLEDLLPRDMEIPIDQSLLILNQLLVYKIEIKGKDTIVVSCKIEDQKILMRLDSGNEVPIVFQREGVRTGMGSACTHSS